MSPSAPGARMGQGWPMLPDLGSLRDRLLTSPRFLRWAGRFPPTRWLARRRARGLFDLCAGFVYSQVLLAGVRTGLFDCLAGGPQPVDALAPRLGLPVAGAHRLLVAAAALRLVERRGRDGAERELFGLGPLGAALVGSPGLAALVEHHALLYRDLADPLALLRGAAGDTALGGYWPYAGAAVPAALEPDQVAAYSALMSASQPMVTAEILDAYGLGRHRRLLDVGGGEGRFAIAAAARAPALSVTLFDLPAVAARATAAFADAGLGGRAVALGGDFHRDPLPAGADLITLVRILHDHDDERVLGLLRAARRALAPGGTLLIAEPLAGTPGAAPMGEAYFGFYLLAMGRGRPRGLEELGDLLGAAGFGPPRLLASRYPLVARILVARPASM